MVKKVIIGLFIVSLGVIFWGQEEDIIIPQNAIRFRVVANSDSLKDQSEKLIIKEEVQKEIYKVLSDADNVGDVRSLISENMEDIEDVVKSYNVPYKISFGYNYFPTKNYKGIMYEAGNYESLVITLGEGVGDNFWCVLFPPLCNLDNSKEDVSDVEYQFYVKKLFDKF